MKKEKKYLIKGSIRYDDDLSKRANLLYDHPDNERAGKNDENTSVLKKRLLSTQEQNHLRNLIREDEIPVIIEPVIIPIEPYSAENNPITDEPEVIVQKKIQAPKISPAERIDYINKPAKQIPKLGGLGVNTTEANAQDIEMKVKPKKVYPEEYEVIGNVKYPKMPEDSQIQMLKKKAKQELFDIEKERFLVHGKNFGAEALMLGSALIPMATGLRLGGGLINAAKPYMGKKIAEELVSGTISGGLSGGLYGLGESLENNKSLVKGTLAGATAGLGSGLFLGLGSGYLSRIADTALIKNVNLDLPKTDKQLLKYKKRQDNYYSDYIEGLAEERENAAWNRLRPKKENKDNQNKNKNKGKENIPKKPNFKVKNVARLYRNNIGAYSKIPINDSDIYAAIHKPNLDLKIAYTRFGWRYDNYYELTPDSIKSAEEFVRVFRENQSKMGYEAAQVFEYSVENYKDMKLFLSEYGTSGFAVKSDGDIVSVFSTAQGSGHSLIELAIQNGGNKLDCFDTYLPDFYAQHGFIQVRDEPWLEEKMPANWDKKAFKQYNKGEPKVIYLKLE